MLSEMLTTKKISLKLLMNEPKSWQLVVDLGFSAKFSKANGKGWESENFKICKRKE